MPMPAFSRSKRGCAISFQASARKRTAGPGQIQDTIDYCGFIGLNPGSKRTYVSTGDSGQGITHGSVAGMLISDLILTGESPWTGVYDPARKPIKAAGTFVSENLTVPKNFAEYVAPGEKSSWDELKPGEGAIVRKWPFQGGRLSRRERQIVPALGALPASRLPRALEQLRTLLGLPLSRLSVRARRHGPKRARLLGARGIQDLARHPRSMTWDCSARTSTRSRNCLFTASKTSITPRTKS